MKKAFSLIELMIVIVIIGVVYTLAISKLKNVSQEKMQVSLSNLKEYLHTYIKEDAKSAKLLCLDACESCSVYVDGVKQEDEIKSFLDASVEVYRYDFNQGAVRKKEEVFFDEEGREQNVCFAFSVNKDMISDQDILVYKEKSYDYTPYFGKTKVYNHLEELLDDKTQLQQEVMQ